MTNTSIPVEEQPIMVDGRPTYGSDFEDDGAGRLAIMGVLVVLAVVLAGIAFNIMV